MLQFPVLIGQGWPSRRHITETARQVSTSGQEVRIANYQYPFYGWDIPFGYLNDDWQIATADWQDLMGFFDLVIGSWNTFLFDDPSDDDTSQFALPVTAPSPTTPSQMINPNTNIPAVGDGVTTAFQLARNMGGALKPIHHTNVTNRAVRVYLTGVLQGSGYTIGSTGLVTFSSAPAVGKVIAADFQFYYLCRWDEDAIEDEQIGPYHMIKSVKIREVIQ